MSPKTLIHFRNLPACYGMIRAWSRVGQHSIPLWGGVYYANWFFQARNSVNVSILLTGGRPSLVATVLRMLT
jgi:hypothetical protein